MTASIMLLEDKIDNYLQHKQIDEVLGERDNYISAYAKKLGVRFLNSTTAQGRINALAGIALLSCASGMGVSDGKSIAQLAVKVAQGKKGEDNNV